MKKILFALVFIVIFATCSASFAASKQKEQVVNSGVLTYLGTTEGEFQQSLDDLRKAVAPLMPTDERDFSEEEMLEVFVTSLVKNRRVVKFFDTLLSMQMALRAGKVDEISLPEAVGMYLVSNNSNYEILFSINMMPSTISFGFKRGNTALQKEFNSAIISMKKDGTLARLERTYISDFSGNPEPIKMQEFKGASTIKVAVTGDLPPIDYIATDGRPTGYNTAILSEIGKRLKKNIRLISVDAGGRSAALASERADVVFWYRNTEGMKLPKKVQNSKFKNMMKDSIEGIILSEPYYEWDTDLIIGRTK